MVGLRLGDLLLAAVKVTDERPNAANDFALEVEKKSYDHYSAGAETTDDERVKKILLRIADEENEHYAILADTRLYLTNPTEWNLKEERPLIDGG